MFFSIDRFKELLPALLVSMTYGRLVPFLTKPLETSTSEAITVVEAEAGGGGRPPEDGGMVEEAPVSMPW